MMGMGKMGDFQEMLRIWHAIGLGWLILSFYLGNKDSESITQISMIIRIDLEKINNEAILKNN